MVEVFGDVNWDEPRSLEVTYRKLRGPGAGTLTLGGGPEEVGVGRVWLDRRG